MGFGAVGVIMLLIVFIFYMRMVEARYRNRSQKTDIERILETADVFESVAKDNSALKVIEQALLDHPENRQLLARKAKLISRLAESSSE